MSDLLAATAALVDVASVSTHEAALADIIEAQLGSAAHLEVTRIGDNLVARTHLGAPARIVVAGHLDTVPPAGNERARIEGESCFGVGSTDMKGGIAVMASLAGEDFAGALDCTYVFYACEEIARERSGLLAIAAARPELLAADAAVLLEPTGARIEAGCQGVVRARVRLGGRRAHSARPWMGTNAIHRAAALLERVANVGERRVVLDGCEYRETLQAVRIAGGVAGNVVPDEVTLGLSLRFAPDRDVATAFAALEAALAPALDTTLGDEVVLEDAAPAAPPALEHPLLARLLAATEAPARAKLGWTDVAFFFERSIPAANYGPGDGLLAHGPDEFVTREELETVRANLAGLLAGGSGQSLRKTVTTLP